MEDCLDLAIRTEGAAGNVAPTIDNLRQSSSPYLLRSRGIAFIYVRYSACHAACMSIQADHPPFCFISCSVYLPFCFRFLLRVTARSFLFPSISRGCHPRPPSIQSKLNLDRFHRKISFYLHISKILCTFAPKLVVYSTRLVRKQ